jgi:hypothetical protein
MFPDSDCNPKARPKEQIPRANLENNVIIIIVLTHLADQIYR